MEALVKASGGIQVLYSHNDLMALGAIEAIKEAGLQPGRDIVVVSVNAVRGALQSIAIDELNCSVECNPSVGPQVLEAVRDLRAGKRLPDPIWTVEGFFDRTNAVDVLPTRAY